MRNIFDQYTHPENRLTHALVSSIAQDDYLMREFIKWTTGQTIAKKETIHEIEQSLPDQMEDSEEEAIPKGLSDACIYTDHGWILIIESKVAPRVSINQLNRHINTLKSRGYTDNNIAKLSGYNRRAFCLHDA